MLWLFKAIEAEVNVHYTDLLTDGEHHYQHLLARQLLKIQVNSTCNIKYRSSCVLIFRCALIRWKPPTRPIVGRHFYHCPCIPENTGECNGHNCVDDYGLFSEGVIVCHPISLHQRGECSHIGLDLLII